MNTCLLILTTFNFKFFYKLVLLNLILHSNYICSLFRNVLFLNLRIFNFILYNYNTKTVFSIQGLDSCLIYIQHLSIMFVATQRCFHLSDLYFNFNYFPPLQEELIKHIIFFRLYKKTI